MHVCVYGYGMSERVYAACFRTHYNSYAPHADVEMTLYSPRKHPFTHPVNCLFCCEDVSSSDEHDACERAPVGRTARSSMAHPGQPLIAT